MPNLDARWLCRTCKHCWFGTLTTDGCPNCGAATDQIEPRPDLSDMAGGEISTQSPPKAQYYGIAWDYNDDSYTRTGALLNTTPENIIGQMFVHDAAEDAVTPDYIHGTDYTLPHIYERRSYAGTTFTIDIALTQLAGFSLCRTSDIIQILYQIERGIWRTFETDITELARPAQLHDQSKEATEHD